MKPISSATTGALNRAAADGNSIGSPHGEIGYAVPRRSRGADVDEDQLAALPATSRPPSALPSVTTTFPPRSPLPPLRPVQVVMSGGKLRPMQALANDSDLSIIRAEIEALTEELEEVDPREVAVAIRKLLAHYGAQAPTDPKLLTEWASDWIADMLGVSSKAFNAAVTSWRQSTERFRPSPGQILAIAKEIELPLRKRLAACFEIEWVATRTTQHKQLEG